MPDLTTSTKAELIQLLAGVGIVIADASHTTKQQMIDQYETALAASETPAQETTIMSENTIEQPVVEPAVTPETPAFFADQVKPHYPRTKSRVIRESVYRMFDETVSRGESIQDITVGQFVSRVLGVAPQWIMRDDEKKIKKHLSWYKSTYLKSPRLKALRDLLQAQAAQARDAQEDLDSDSMTTPIDVVQDQPHAEPSYSTGV